MVKLRRVKNSGAVLLEPEAVLLDARQNALDPPTRAAERRAAKEAAQETVQSMASHLPRRERRVLERRLAKAARATAKLQGAPRG